MKKEIILENLIKTYLNEQNPISSGELKRKCELPFSPSTIRNYFQKLDGEGLIVKVHISSGSIPSKDALRDYWYRNLLFDGINVSSKQLEEIAKEFDVFISYKEKQNLILKNVFNVANKFIILDFDTDEVVLKYQIEILYLFKEFIGYNLDDIKKMIGLVKLNHILNKFSINKIENFNREFLYKHYKDFSIDDLLSEKLFDKFNYGLSFNQDFLAYKIDAKVDTKDTEFIVIGNIYNNYLELFDSIKEAS
jgi:heat-inducible transcriptional repressor